MTRIPPPQPGATPLQRDGDGRPEALAKPDEPITAAAAGEEKGEAPGSEHVAAIRRNLPLMVTAPLAASAHIGGRLDKIEAEVTSLRAALQSERAERQKAEIEAVDHENEALRLAEQLAAERARATAAERERDEARACLGVTRGIVTEMREDATKPKGGQSVGPRRMPVPLSIIKELEQALGPSQGEYTAQAYYDLTEHLAAAERSLSEARGALKRATDEWERCAEDPDEFAEIRLARCALAAPEPGTERGEGGRNG